MSKLKWIGWVSSAAVILLVTAAGITFRIYPLLQPVQSVKKQRSEMAENVIRSAIRQQVAAGIQQQFPQIDSKARMKMVEAEVDRTIQRDRQKFDLAVLNMTSTLPSNPAIEKFSRHYLLGADSYHYFQLTKNIQKTGHISEEFKQGTYFNGLRHAPMGLWSPVNLHPYLGYGWYRVMSFWNSKISLMEAGCYFPLFLMFVSVLLFFWLCRILGLGHLACLAGGFTLVLAPIFIQRSYFGWYDTDPYNFLFPVLILALFFQGSRSRSYWAGWAVCAGAVTAVYSFFWVGWPFIFLLIIGTGIAVVLVRIFRKDIGMDYAGGFIVVYGLAALLALVLLMSPKIFWGTLCQNFKAVAESSLPKFNLWPNVFITVGETRPVTLTKVIYLTGNYVTAALAVLCLAVAGIDALHKQRRARLSAWMVFFLGAIPLLMMSLMTERFSLLLLIPVVMFVAMGVDALNGWLRDWAGKRWPKGPVTVLIKSMFGVVVLAVLLPMQVLLAHNVSVREKSLMDDVWFDSLNGVRTQTPAESIIHSWWPPGHFITALAERRVIADGGTQDFPECYWLARFFMSQSETEALGILRMLDTSGNQAVTYLEKLGFDLPRAIALINEIVPLNREGAGNVLEPYLAPKTREQLLDMTHPEDGLPPSVILIYNEMVDQNLAMSLMARWDFKAAAALREEKQAQFSAGESMSDYVDDFIEVSHGILRYRTGSKLRKRDGDMLYFHSGLQVNLKDLDSWIQLPKGGAEGKPVSLFVLAEHGLTEVVNEGKRIDISALVYPQDKSYGSVLAHRDLINSMLFRLYYLQGAELRFFKPLIKRKDDASKTIVYVFEVDWPAFVRGQRSKIAGKEISQ